MNNVVGKILIVMQLVFSLCFMCFAGAVYSFQAGWKGKAQTAESKLADSMKNIRDLQDRNTQLDEKAKNDVAAEKQRADGAEARVAQLETSLGQALGNQQKAEQQRDKHLADLEVAAQEARARLSETTEGREEIKRLRDQVNDGIVVRRQLEDEKLDLAGQLAVAEEQKQNALRIIADLKGKLRYHGVDPEDTIAGPIPVAIEKIDGVVTGARKNASRSSELVEVSVGSDDGISKRMRLIVYRDADFICEIEVTDVFPDSAVGRVIEETRNGTVERGDNVTTKL